MVYILLILLILSTVFHQSLFLLIPVFTGTYFYIQKTTTLPYNGIIKNFSTLFFVVSLFLIVQSLLNLSITFEGVKGVFKIFLYLCIAILGVKLNLKTIERFIIFSLILNLLLWPLTYKNIDPSGGYSGIFQHSNHLAYTLVICMYFLYYHINMRVLYKAILLILSGVLVLFTKTSGAILILAILLIYQLTFSNKIKLKYKLLFLLGPFFLLIPLIYVFSGKIIAQFESLDVLSWRYLNRRIRTGTSGGYGSVVWRITYWLQILHEFDKENILSQFFGVGIGSMTKGHYPYKVVYKDPHNDFLKILIEYGYSGLILFTVFLFKLYRNIKFNFNLIVITIIPLFFDNMIVNFSIMMTLILTLAYEYRVIK